MQGIKCALLSTIVVVASGCGSHYVTPGGGASLADFAVDLQADPSITQGNAAGDVFVARSAPASPFPANLAIIRVQDSGYQTKTNHGYGHGRYSIVTTRDIETDADFEKVSKLPLVQGVAPVGRLLVPVNANTTKDLRVAAAQLRADLLLVYSVDTSFAVDGQSLGPLSLISLGLLPNKQAHVTSTVAGLLIDVRTGYVYGTTEASAREQQRATVWSSEMAVESSRLKAERQAFESFVDEFQDMWGNVLNVYAATTPRPAPAATAAGNTYYRIQFNDP